MSEVDHARDARQDEPTDDSKLIDELIFRQYLDEVHLLMDFVSGRAMNAGWQMAVLIEWRNHGRCPF